MKAVIIFSGGLDSTTVLANAVNQGYDCHALTFDYGQRHDAELQAARNIAKHYSVPHKIIKLPLRNLIAGSALTDDTIDVPEYTGCENIPTTYVPARNTIFLSVALGYAEVIGANDLFIGVSSVDYSGYPDCRPEYYDAFEKLACLATKAGVEGNPFTIHRPLIHLSKAQTIELGMTLGLDYSMTVSCYQANSRGEACGTCDSCALRKKGFVDAGIEDPTRYGVVA